MVGDIGTVAQLSQHTHSHILVDRVVLDDQNPQPALARSESVSGRIRRLVPKARVAHEIVEQLALTHRLGQNEVHGPSRGRFFNFGLAGRRRHDQPCPGKFPVGPNDYGEVQSGHFRHLMIQQHDLERFAGPERLTHGGQPLHRRSAGDGQGAPVGELALEYLPIDIHVIDDQDPQVG